MPAGSQRHERRQPQGFGETSWIEAGGSEECVSACDNPGQPSQCNVKHVNQLTATFPGRARGASAREARGEDAIAQSRGGLVQKRDSACGH